MAVLQQLFVLLTTLSAVYSQTVLTLTTAEVITLSTGSLYPVRTYAGSQRIPDGNSANQAADRTLDQCLRECINDNNAVAPIGTPTCNAIDFLVGGAAGTVNCITHYDAPCSIATGLYAPPAAGITVTHYKVVHICGKSLFFFNFMNSQIAYENKKIENSTVTVKRRF